MKRAGFGIPDTGFRTTVVLAHFGVPRAEHDGHIAVDRRWTERFGNALTARAANNYLTIYNSLSLEERLAAEAAL